MGDVVGWVNKVAASGGYVHKVHILSRFATPVREATRKPAPACGTQWVLFWLHVPRSGEREAYRTVCGCWHPASGQNHP